MQPVGDKRKKKQTSWKKKDEKWVNDLYGIFKMHPELPCFFFRPFFAIMPVPHQKVYDSFHLEGSFSNELPVDGGNPAYISHYLFMEPIYFLPHFDPFVPRFFINTTLTRWEDVIISEKA